MFARYVNIFLVVLSACLLVLGLALPVAAKVYNPFLAYWILLVGPPAWAVGATAGGVAGYRAMRQEPSQSVVSALGWLLCATNILSAFSVGLVHFYVS